MRYKIPIDELKSRLLTTASWEQVLQDLEDMAANFKDRLRTLRGCDVQESSDLMGDERERPPFRQA